MSSRNAFLRLAPRHLARQLVALFACAGLAACGGDVEGAGEALAPSEGEPESEGAAAVEPEPMGPTGTATPPGDPEPENAPPPGASEEPAAELPTETPTVEPEAPTGPEEPAEPVPAVTSDGLLVDGVCQPVCSGAATDPDGDGWGWENDASCVVPDSSVATGRSPCDTDDMSPPETPSTPASGDGYDVDGACMPICLLDDSDPDGDGWGWENEASCVVEASPAAAGRVRCSLDPAAEPSAEPNPETPAPAPTEGDATRPAGGLSTGFFVSGGRLYDGNGNDFVIRGINHGHYWFRPEMNQALPAIAGTGANTIRIVWESEGTADELRSVLEASIALELVPMVELHDVTGDPSNARLLDMARYYTRSDVLAVLLEFERHLLVNIANEWSGEDWLGGYEAAISELRDAGIHHTLVIDANGWGQEASTILNDGQALLTLDPQQNLLFSVHMYQNFASASAITSALEGAQSRALPLIVGEFGFQHGTPVTQIPYQTILDECARLGIGYIPWSWKGNNSEVAYLDMSVDWSGSMLTDWGRGVIDGSNGIRSTAQRASVFLLDD